MNEFEQRLQVAHQLIPFMEIEAAKLLVKNQLHIFEDMIQGNNDQIIWTNMVMPTEILYAADLIPIHTELIAGWFSTLKLSSKYIHIAQMKGYNVNLCSYHKTIIGALEEGLIPPPKIAVFSSHICDGGSLLARYLKERFGTLVRIMDVPYECEKENVHWIYEQLLSLKDWLQEYTKKEITIEKLQRAVYESNQERNYLCQVNEIRKGDISFRGNLAIRNMYGATFLLGSKLGEEVGRTYYEEMKRKDICHDRKHRILWIHFAPLYGGEMMKYFEEELGCQIVFDITSYVYWKELTLADPIESIARKVMAHFFLGDVTYRLELYKRLIEEYRIDGIVMFMHQGCRAIPCSSWELRELSKQRKLPFLELSGDCIDPESFSEEQMRLRMEAFKEGLDNRNYVSRN